MRGHICRRGKRSWAVVLELPRDPETGRRRQKWHSVKGLRRDAERLLAELLHNLDTQQYTEPTKLTLAAYLDDWLQQVASTVRPTTWRSYEVIVRRHITPALGRLPLSQLTAPQIQRWVLEQLGGGRADGRGKELSARTVHFMYAVLSMALRRAVKLGILGRNVAEMVTPPRAERREVPGFNVEFAADLLRVAGPTRLYLPVLLAVMTGMRRGEILGLRWADVDLGAATVEVRQTQLAGGRFAPPKTDRGRRRVALPGGLVEALKVERERQAQYRALFGAGYEEYDLVIAHETGHPWEPTTLGSAFRSLTRRMGLQGVRFHDLRHLHATLLLRQGVHPKIVADRLGHSRVSLTLDTYSHALPDLQQDAARAIDAILPTSPTPH